MANTAQIHDIVLGDEEILVVIGNASTRISINSDELTLVEAVNAAFATLGEEHRVFTRDVAGNWVLNGNVYQIKDGEVTKITDPLHRPERGATYVGDQVKSNG